MIQSSAALVLGLLFGLVSLPCAGAILLVLLSIVASKGALFDGTLLACYCLGHCALVLAGGLSMGFVQRVIASKGCSGPTSGPSAPPAGS